MVGNPIVNGTPAALGRASTCRYGSAKYMDHYRWRRQDGKTARRQEMLRLFPSILSPSPHDLLTLTSSLRARPGSIMSLFSTLAGRGYHSSSVAGQRGAKGYAPPGGAWSRTARHSLTSWRSPPQLTADRHVRRNCYPRTSQAPCGSLPNQCLRLKERRRQSCHREDPSACRSVTALHLPRAPVPSRRVPDRGTD